MSFAAATRVLVVDDAPQVRQTFGRFLMLAGMLPSFAVDGLDGLAAVRASRPDLVLCDLEMPRMSGIDLCTVLRADTSTRRLPIVVVTTSGGAAAAAAIAAGCDAVLPKPVSRALLLATVRDLLARAEAAATAPMPPLDEPR